MPDDFDFSGLTATELTDLRAELYANLMATVNVGQSYSMGGRSFTKMNPAECSRMLSAVTRAQRQLTGAIVRTVHADMSNG